MKIPQTFEQTKKRHAGYEEKRRRVIEFSNKALNRSKRAIFAMHRSDTDAAARHLSEADDHFSSCESFFETYPKLAYEGAYRAALEEYVEAQLFSGFLQDGGFGDVHERAVRPDAYLAGLSDMTGEVVRYATRRATDGEYKAVDEAIEVVSEAVSYLLELDLRGHVRKKADQAKRNLRKLEEMRYEINLRK